jgi:hypothetical protein
MLGAPNLGLPLLMMLYYRESTIAGDFVVQFIALKRHLHW